MFFENSILFDYFFLTLTEEVNRCGTVSCQRNVDNCGSRKISCSLNFTSFELSRISSVHYTVFDCSNYHLVSFVRAKCQLDIDCEKVLSSNLSRPYETNMQPVYCDSHTNRIKCLVFQITFGEMSLFFNETVDGEFFFTHASKKSSKQ